MLEAVSEQHHTSATLQPAKRPLAFAGGCVIATHKTAEF